MIPLDELFNEMYEQVHNRGPVENECLRELEEMIILPEHRDLPPMDALEHVWNVAYDISRFWMDVRIKVHELERRLEES